MKFFCKIFKIVWYVVNMHKIVLPVSFGKIIISNAMFSKLWHHISEN